MATTATAASRKPGLPQSPAGKQPPMASGLGSLGSLPGLLPAGRKAKAAKAVPKQSLGMDTVPLWKWTDYTQRHPKWEARERIGFRKPILLFQQDITGLAFQMEGF